MRTTALLSIAALALTACGDSEAEIDPRSLEAIEGSVVASDSVTQSEAPDGLPAEAPTLLDEPEGSLATTEMSLGDPDAPLTVVEYASVTCPGCAAFHANHFQAIKSELIEPGLVRFVYREFPTSPVPLSYAGSILARCAATEAGAPAYFAVNDALFTRQNDWVYGANPGQALEAIFAQVGMDRAKMQSCLRRGELKAAIDDNIELGREDGVQGTPTLMVDGERFDVRRDVDETVAELRAMAEAAR